MREQYEWKIDQNYENGTPKVINQTSLEKRDLYLSFS